MDRGNNTNSKMCLYNSCTDRVLLFGGRSAVSFKEKKRGGKKEGVKNNVAVIFFISRGWEVALMELFAISV